MTIGSPTQRIYPACLKDNPHNLTKYESKESILKSLLIAINLFHELRKINNSS